MGLSDELEEIKNEHIKQKRTEKEAHEAGNSDTALKDGDFDEIILSMITSTTVTLDDIAGLDKAKETIRESVSFIGVEGRPDPWKGVLLFGPPGTGKTMLAAATAGSFKATFFNVKISDLLSKYFGESSKIISALYKVARKKAPSIIFIDEIDSIAGKRNPESEASRRILSTLLSEMDGLHNKISSQHVVTMAATNTPWDLDNAVLSRFEKRIYTPLPDEQAVREMIKQDIGKKGVKLDGDMQKTAKNCVLKLFAGRDVATLCKEAHWNMWREQNETDKISNLPPDNIKNSPSKIRSLSESDFEKSLSKVKGTVKKKDVIEHEKWAKMYAPDEPPRDLSPNKGYYKFYKGSIILCIFVLIFFLFPPAPPPPPTPPPIYNSLGWEFVMIPSGEFDMGSPQDQKFRDEDEGPVHHVKIDKGFSLSRTEITQKQWHDVMGTDPSYFKGDNLPVEQVSWNDVQEFINKLNMNDSNRTYRLPSEAEWEYAAGAGNKTIYDFGDNESMLGDYAWYNINSDRRTHEVGMKKSNTWGLYDMHGNVWEWVLDKYHNNYNGAPVDGSAWEGNATNRIIRGGSFDYYYGHLSLTSRNDRDPDYRHSNTGFRLVMMNATKDPVPDSDFVLIPTGEFDMGSPEDRKLRDKDEGPIHHVNISRAFKMSKYEITQKQWRDVMGTDPSYFRGDNLPVEQVSWNDVQEFIKKLNYISSPKKYRLPSEAEWEYAAGAGNNTMYHFGDNEAELGDYEWYNNNSGSQTHEAGMKKPNTWGLYDIHGNVWEWVQDKYHDTYQGAPADGSAWEGNATNRIIRGGSFDYYYGHLRLTNRNDRNPDFRHYNTGFRLVMDS